MILRSSGLICIQRSALRRNACRSSGGIAIHRSRGLLFWFGICRGAEKRREFPPCGWALDICQPKIKIAAAASALTAFAYRPRRPTNCYRLLSATRPGPRQHRNPAARSLPSHPARLRSHVGAPADAALKMQLRARPLHPRWARAVLELAKRLETGTARDVREPFEECYAQKTEKAGLAEPDPAGPIIVGRLRVSFLFAKLNKHDSLKLRQRIVRQRLTPRALPKIPRAAECASDAASFARLLPRFGEYAPE